MKDNKVKITKKEFYDLGGFENSNLFRKQVGKTNGWSYYKLVNESMKSLQSILEQNNDDWKAQFEKALGQLQALTKELNSVRFNDAVRSNRELSNKILFDVVNQMDNAYHNGADILTNTKLRR